MKVLSFGAVWCPSCILMKLRWEKIQKELSWLQIEYYDYNQDKEMIARYNIGRDIPLAIFLDQQNNELNRWQGEIDRQELIKFLGENKDK
jgi:thiol-disulfide isomerase/thioredoxin